MRNVQRKMGNIFIRFVTFTSNLVYSVVYNQSGLSTSILFFVNRTTVKWSSPSFTNSECATNDTSVYAFSKLLSLHNSVAFIIIVTAYFTPTSFLLAGAIIWIGTAKIRLDTCVPHGVHWPLIRRFYIKIQSDITVNSYPHKYFLNYSMDHLTAASSPTKRCL